MNKTKTLLVATSLAIALSGVAEAGDSRHRYHDHRPPRHDYRPPPPRIVHHHHGNWIGPAAVLTLGGIALGAALSPPPPPPRPVYVLPPQAAGNWYYCRSSGQYYPYTTACPEGWRAVAPR